MYSKHLFENLLIYLNKYSWKEIKTQYKGLNGFRNSEIGLSIVLPKSFDAPDINERINDVIDLITTYTNTQKEVFTNLLERFSADFHNYRVPEKDIDSVSLGLADNIISSTKRIIFHSAQETYTEFITEFKKEKRSKSDVSKEYIDQCRFGHTWRGSFGFTIEAPLNPKSLGIFNDTTPSFERKVSLRIHDGIKIIKKAEELHSDSYIIDNIETGFNGKMLSEILDIADSIKYNKLEYSTTWAPALPVQTEYIETKHYELSASTFNLIEKAVSKLNVDDEEFEITFLGFPEGLRSSKEQLLDKELEGNRFIRVRGVSKSIKETVLQMELSYSDYLKAVHAHENHKDLKIKCIVKRKPRGWEVVKIKSFEISN